MALHGSSRAKIRPQKHGTVHQSQSGAPPAPPAPLIGASTNRQRIIGAPATGNFPTLPAIPAWQPMTGYDSVALATMAPALVTNGGNVYQCINSGMSGSGPGPQGVTTGVEGSVNWRYVGPNPGAVNTVSGSTMVVAVARGLWSAASPAAPSDNKGNIYSLVGSVRSYGGFPQSALGVYQSANITGGAAHTFTANWGQFGGVDEGDEITTSAIEIRNVGPLHTNSWVERANATGGNVTTASVTLSVRCLCLVLWGGNGNVVTPGTPHTATPAAPLTFLSSASSLIALPGSGYIQFAAAWCMRDPGSHTFTWATNGEGAQLFVLAYPVL